MRTFAQPTFRPARSSRAVSAESREAHPFPRLQRTSGKQAVQRLLYPAVLPKLTADTPGDAYEQEADRVAEQVTGIPEVQLQHGCACGGECPQCKKEQEGHGFLQTKRIQSHDVDEAAALPGLQKVLSSVGRPLDPATRGFMEPRFGRDFSLVRVHDDARAADSARSIGARAYAAGHDLVFAASEYAPNTSAGKRLLAHELTHVIQQSAASPSAGGTARETGGAAHVSKAVSGSRIQRACRAEIPDRRSECLGESGTLAEPFFRFRVGCDEFLNTTERDNFSALLARVVPGDVFRVRGFASEEGGFDLNHRLSCARALFAATELERRGAIITERIAHGPQSADPRDPRDRENHRSVVVEQVAVPGSGTSRPCAAMQTVNVAIFPIPGNSRDPFADLTFANRVYADCCVQFRSVGGATLDAALLGTDAMLQHSGDCDSFSAEEESLITVAERAAGSAKIWIFYVPNFEPQSDAKGLACALSSLSGNRLAIPSMILVAADADPVTLAHELGHLLIDTSDHHGIDNPSDPGNVMVAPRVLSGGIRITADASQCAQVRSNLGRLP